MATFTDPKIDRARRASDLVRIHYLAKGFEANGSWLAIRLSDGSSDNILYPTKKDAVEHQLHPQQCAYFCMDPQGENAADMKTYLDFMEGLYDNGYDLGDPKYHFMPRG